MGNKPAKGVKQEYETDLNKLDWRCLENEPISSDKTNSTCLNDDMMPQIARLPTLFHFSPPIWDSIDHLTDEQIKAFLTKFKKGNCIRDKTILSTNKFTNFGKDIYEIILGYLPFDTTQIKHN
eukprot:421177_1